MAVQEAMSFGFEDSFRDEAFARATLRDAVHKRTVSELRCAIENAEAAGTLYDLELQNARRALDMQRKCDARDMIAEAKLSQDVIQLQAAIAEAEAVGLPAGELDAALGALAEEARRDAAREGLRAVASGATLEEFYAALREGEASGLPQEELDFARAALEVEEQSMAARQALHNAVRSRDMPELRRALEVGNRVGLQGFELFEAERVLEEEERKVMVKGNLKDALLKKVPTHDEQVKMLREAIDQAYDTGLDIMDIERAKWHLEFEERQLNARETLLQAMKTQRLEDLKPAIQESLEAGVAQEEVKRAQGMLAESYKPAARERLRAAVAGRDVEELRAALAHGESMGISELGLTEARQALADEEQKAQARQKLIVLVGNGRQPYSLPAHPGFQPKEGGYTLGDLRAAVRFGEGSGLPEAELAHSQKILREEERKVRARNGLRDAQAARSIAQLEAALAEGSAASLEDPEVFATSRQLLDDLIKAKARDHLASAAAAQPPLTPEALREAIAEAVEAGLADEEADEVRSILVVEERKVAARAGLAAALALEPPDLAALKAALGEAEAAKLTYTELKPIKEAVAREQELCDSRAALSAALAPLAQPPSDNDEVARRPALVRTLVTAIKRGRTVKLTPEELALPVQALAVEDDLAAIRVALSEAIDSGDIAELRAALGRASSSSLPQRELSPAASALEAALNASAGVALAAASGARDPGALRAALTDAEEAGVDPAAIEGARRVLAEELLRRALANPSSHALNAAIANAEASWPGAADLAAARAALVRQDRLDVARERLRNAERALIGVPGAHERHEELLRQLLVEIRAGHDDGLEEWEMRSASKLLREQSLAKMEY